MQPHRPRAFVARSLPLLGFWLLLLEPDSLAPAEIGVDLLVGALAAFAAALVSMRLLPPAARGPRLWPLLRYLLRFLAQSLLVGLDVARRALDPRLPVDPGLLRQPTALRGATRRWSTATIEPARMPTRPPGHRPAQPPDWRRPVRQAEDEPAGRPRSVARRSPVR